MYSSYIRPLSFDYRDAQEKQFQVQEVPQKFKQERDDYKPRIRHKPVEIESEEEVVPYAPPPPPAEPLPETQPCCSCLTRKKEEAQLCANCMGMLCENCIQMPSQVRKCIVCRPQLCVSCSKALGVKQAQMKLRSYPIKLKDVVTMHFVDCKCEHCHNSN